MTSPAVPERHSCYLQSPDTRLIASLFISQALNRQDRKQAQENATQANLDTKEGITVSSRRSLSVAREICIVDRRIPDVTYPSVPPRRRLRPRDAGWWIVQGHIAVDGK